MTSKISNINFTLPTSHSNNLCYLFYSLQNRSFEIGSLIEAKLYTNNKIGKDFILFSNGSFSSLHIHCTQPILNLKFQGIFNCSLLLRGNTIRISTGFPAFLQIHHSVFDNIDTFIYMLSTLITTDFPSLSINHLNYSILLINLVLTFTHPVPQNFDHYSHLPFFSSVLLPNFAGGIRRKGSLRLCINSNGKNGKIIVNNFGYSFMGFDSILLLELSISLLS